MIIDPVLTLLLQMMTFAIFFLEDCLLHDPDCLSLIVNLPADCCFSDPVTA